MTRIATYGSSQLYISRILAVQQRIHETQLQVSTEKKAQTYSGIAAGSNSLINFENEKSLATSFIDNNSMAETKLRAAMNSVDAIGETIKNFKSVVDTMSQNGLATEQQVKDLQRFSWQSMVDMAAYLNININGEYPFAGGRTSTIPVELPASTLAEFQSKFDGVQNKAATTRSVNLNSFAIRAADIGTATFDATYGLVRPSKFDAFDDIRSGSLFTVAGSTSNNNTLSSKGMAALNLAENPVAETATIGAAFVLADASGTYKTQADTGNLAFAFNPAGEMTITPATSGSLSHLTAGTRFSINNSTASNWDGTYVVQSVNSDGSISIVSDSSLSAGETTTASAVTLKKDSADADAIPDTTVNNAVTLGLTGTEAVSFTVSGNTVTMTMTGASNLDTEFPANSLITLSGLETYNGTFKVIDPRTGDSLTFEVSPTAMRVTTLAMPQTGRTDVTMSWNTGADTRVAANYGSLSFGMTAGGETLTAATANGFEDGLGNPYPPVGAIITLDSTSGVNDGKYTVKSNDGTNIVIESTVVTAETTTTATVTNQGWYRGDTLQQQHRMDTGRTLKYGIYASDPAFEKAFRAMALIAQGEYGTAGGLENNQERLTAAKWLMEDALEDAPAAAAPFGAEESGDIRSTSSMLAVNVRSILDANTKHKSFIGFLDTRIVALENVDKTEAIAKLLDDQRALEAGYEALSRVRALTLLDHLR